MAVPKQIRIMEKFMHHLRESFMNFLPPQKSLSKSKSNSSNSSEDPTASCAWADLPVLIILQCDYSITHQYITMTRYSNRK